MDFTNTYGVSLALLPWLVRDTYDHNDDPYTLSATYFNQSIRQMVLSNRAGADPELKALMNQPVDVTKMVASRIGTAIHDSIEAAWYDEEAVKTACKLAGLPRRVQENIVVNPPEGTDTSGKFVVFMEQRLSRKIGKYTITGKPDFVIAGELTDFKSTSAFVVTKDVNSEKYRRQGSIYRFLDPELITSNILTIDYIIKDFSKAQAGKNDYPAQPLPAKKYPLWEPEETEHYLNGVLKTVESLADAPDCDIPYCTPEELWQSPTVYKYYKNPEKTVRATRNFDNMQDAELLRVKNGVGIVIAVQGEAKACNWCAAKNICNQYAEMHTPVEPKDELSPDS